LADRTPEAPSEGSVTDYTMGYFVVFLGIALGLLSVLRASNRREREKPQQYQERNLLAQED